MVTFKMPGIQAAVLNCYLFTPCISFMTPKACGFNSSKLTTGKYPSHQYSLAAFSSSIPQKGFIAVPQVCRISIFFLKEKLNCFLLLKSFRDLPQKSG